MVKFALLMYMSEFRLSVVVLIRGNSTSLHLGVQSTFKGLSAQRHIPEGEPIVNRYVVVPFITGEGLSRV